MIKEKTNSNLSLDLTDDEKKFDEYLEEIKKASKLCKFNEWDDTAQANVPTNKKPSIFKKEGRFELLRVPQGNENYVPINNNYFYNSKYILGSGGFGFVYYGADSDRKNEYAIKFQNSSKGQTLNHEIKILEKLKGEEGFPQIFYHNTFDKKNFLVETLLGPSLERLFKFCTKTFTPQIVAKLGKEMVIRLRQLHKKGIIHRDIKPNNFSFGKFHTVINTKNNNEKKKDLINNFNYFENEIVYLIDFGLSIEQSENNRNNVRQNNFVGTLRYASLNSHLCVKQGKRDDLESFFYLFCYFYSGKLPWENLKIKDKRLKEEEVAKRKKILDETDYYKDLPKQFKDIYEHICMLSIYDEPNYDYILGCLDSFLSSVKVSLSDNNFLWDWEYKIIRYNIKNSFGCNDLTRKEFVNLFSGYPIIYESYYRYVEDKFSKVTNSMTSSTSCSISY